MINTTQRAQGMHIGKCKCVKCFEANMQSHSGRWTDGKVD